MSKNNEFLLDLVLLRYDPEGAAQVRERALAGQVDAQYAMGLICAEGRGVAESCVESYAWLTLAIAQGDADARVLRDVVVFRMSDHEITEAQRLAGAYQGLIGGAGTWH